MIVHHRTFDTVLVRSWEVPGRGNAAGGDVVDGVATGVVDARDLAVVYIAGEEIHVVGVGCSNEVEHALLFVREIGPGLVPVEFDGELGAAADESDVGGLFQFSLQPFPLLGTE